MNGLWTSLWTSYSGVILGRMPPSARTRVSALHFGASSKGGTLGRLGMAVQAAVLLGIAAVPGAAFGQTTTSTTSSTSVTTTTVGATTTTTLPNPCADRPCTTEPPGAVLSTSSTQLVPDRGSYCWRQPAGDTTMCLALAAVPGYKPPLLVVTEGELVTVRFTAPVPLAPEDVALVKAGERLVALPAANPTEFRVDLPPGLHESVWLSTRWLQGELQYSFRLEVRARPEPTPPAGRTLALTG